MINQESQILQIVDLIMHEIPDEEKGKISDELIRNIVEFLESESLKGTSRLGLEVQLGRIISEHIDND